MAKSWKNEPCPCGSGHTYGECCYAADATGGQVGPAAELLEDFIASLGGAQPASLGELQAELNRFTASRNSDPVDAFCGLSPDQMHRLLHFPFDSHSLVEFNLDVKSFPESPFLRIFSFLLQGAVREGLKATVKGNLPRNFVREAALWYYGEEEYQKHTRYVTFQTETDFFLLHIVRLVAGLTGYIKKRKNRFHATRAGNAVVKNGIDGKVFLDLFKAYTMKLNWGYCDRYPDLHIVQASFLFMLYALTKYGDIFRPISFYEDLFMAAFPLAVREIAESTFWSRDDVVKRCVSFRMLSRFALFFGFVEPKEPRDERWFEKNEVRKTPFLNQWVQFHV